MNAETREALVAVIGDWWGHTPTETADALLDGLLAPLLEKVARVEALADELASWPAARILSPTDAAGRIRAALRGDS